MLRHRNGGAETTQKPETVFENRTRNVKVSWEAGTGTDPGGRDKNEDTVRYETAGEEAFCILVADGLGGHGGGEIASAAAADVICKGFTVGTGAAGLKELVLAANRKVLSLQTRLCEMKSTVVVLTVSGGHAVWAHVGDSRLYHFLDGKLIFQTRDHSVAQMSVMLGDITPEQIRFHEDRSRVLRALGQDDRLAVELKEEELACGSHAFLLCSDGFWEYVLEDEMEDALQAAEDPDDWIRRMREYLTGRVCEMYGDQPENDNNTAAVVWITVREDGATPRLKEKR